MLEAIFDELHRIESEFGEKLLFYRGHADSTWSLLPALARRNVHPDVEVMAYYDFVTRAGSLLSNDEPGWSHVFAMQHYGIPTRLLDWTTTFGVALFFAVRGGLGDGAIWILDPFALNEASHQNSLLPTPSELPMNYYEAFISKEKEIPAKIVAISPMRFNPRVFNQRAAFTLHTDIISPLEILYPKVVKKITISKRLKKEADEFLRLAGISEYSLFPDLDGLARDLISEYFR